MLTCQQLTELVTEYAEGRMSFWRRLEVQLHLGMCSNCRAYLRQMQMTARALGKLPQQRMPDDLRAEMLERLRRMGPPDER